MASTLTDLEELKQDLNEIVELQKLAKRKRVQDTLAREIDRLRREVLSLESKVAAREAKEAAGKASTSSGGGDQVQQGPGYLENITNYAWDQSDKFMKLYLTLGNLNTITEQSINGQFTKKSVIVKVQFSNKTSQLHIARLCEEISPDECYCKKKSDYVLVMLKKAAAGKTWPTVTDREKKTKESKDKSKVDENEDPSAGITKMLKNMYDEGDDEMKRTISKAMYESQMKKGKEGDPMGMGGMGGLGGLGGLGGMDGMGGLGGMGGL